jgi:hypothetical protein
MREFLNEFVPRTAITLIVMAIALILWDGLRSDNGVIVPAVVRGLILVFVIIYSFRNGFLSRHKELRKLLSWVMPCGYLLTAVHGMDHYINVHGNWKFYGDLVAVLFLLFCISIYEMDYKRKEAKTAQIDSQNTIY